MPKTITTEEFISRARAIHKDKYDYSEVSYKGRRSKVSIICPTHGIFHQMPDVHLRGSGCLRCSKENPLNNHSRERINEEEFLRRARTKFGEKYNYSRAHFLGMNKKIEIICPIHGSFYQTPYLHLASKTGCPACSRDLRSFTKEKFINRAKGIHDNKYDYSAANYIDYTTPVKIFCKECQEYFWQTPSNHLQGTNCPTCSKKLADEKKKGKNSLALEEFTERAQMIHNSKYDYSKVNYINSRTKVEIICPVHGSFWQIPNGHLQGHGCPDCRNDISRIHLKAHNPNKSNLEDFIKKSRNLYGDKYDYSEVIYINNKTKVKILCKKHNENFWVSPDRHLNQKQECPICTRERLKKERTRSTEDFIQKSKEIFGDDKFDYSLANYSGVNNYITLICHDHGPFEVCAGRHLRQYQGCPVCSKEKIIQNLRFSKEEFIEKARRIHGDKYDYSKANYVDMKTKVEIICPEHGSFWTTPHNHIHYETQCPHCNKTRFKGEKVVKRWLSNHDISFSCYQKYSGLVYKKALNTDFYIESHNLAIEYQGIQHYKSVSFYGMTELEAQKQFEEQLEKDRIKEEYFANSAIDLLCIHYKDYKIIGDILQKVIIEKDFSYLENTNSYMF